MYYSAAVMDSKKLKMIQTHHVNYFYGKSYCVFNNVTFNNIMVCYTNLACLIKKRNFCTICCVSIMFLLCPAWYDRRDIMFFGLSGCPSVLLSVLLSVRHTLGVPLCVQHPANYAFSTNYYACIAMPT